MKIISTEIRQKRKVKKVMRRCSWLKVRNTNTSESPETIKVCFKYSAAHSHSHAGVTRQTLALASAGVALSFVRVDSTGVTVAGLALHLGVSPEVGLALVALPASEAWLAGTLASEEVTLLFGGA